MHTTKKLAVWMDHASAHLVEFAAGGPEGTKTIDSKFTHEHKEQTLHKSEKLMHNSENHMHSEYYKKIGEAIRNYDEVLLFGPTEAKSELLNVLKGDHHFAKINFNVRQADRMTENQQHAFVRDYFSKR